MAGKWLTVTQAAKVSGYKPHYVRELLRGKRIRGKKWGDVWQVDQASLLAYRRQVEKLGAKRGAKPKI